MQSPKYESYFIINKRREYQNTTISNHSLQPPYKSTRDNLHSPKTLSVTSRCHRIVWEKNKENLVLGGVKTYLTGRKIAQQQISHSIKAVNTKNNNLNSLNRSYNGAVTWRQSNNNIAQTFPSSTKSNHSQLSSMRKQLTKGLNQMRKSLYNRQQVQSKVQIQIKPVTQQYPYTQQQSNITLNLSEEKSNSNYPLSYKYRNYEDRKRQTQVVTQSIINRHSQLLENSIKTNSHIGNSRKNHYENTHFNHQAKQMQNEANKKAKINIQKEEGRLRQNYLNIQILNNQNNSKDKTDYDGINQVEQQMAINKNPLFDSSVRSSKKSRILQYKQQCNHTLEQQEIVQTQIIPTQTVKDQSGSLKSFTKDQMCSSFYDQQEEHPPHKLLIVNSHRKNNRLPNQRKQTRRSTRPNDYFNNNLLPIGANYAMTVREHSNQPSSEEEALSSRSMREHLLQRKTIENHSLVISGENRQDKSSNLNFILGNIQTSQSQHIKPSKPHYSEQVITVKGFSRNQNDFSLSQSKPNPLGGSQNQNIAPVVINIGSSFQKVLDLNPKPCESFILQSSQQTSQLHPKTAGLFLEGFYEQQLKRRTQTNQILKSLMDMKMIQETIEMDIMI